MHGLSTLNRLLGKKNKEASRSSTNLSLSTSNLDTSSQHNKISPIVNNAPFEQTFRVTVYLPKKQLYVERIGAKTKLSSLLERICENKDLTADKYEFRHPGDMSQVFNNDKTIGEVGLNELKLVLKTESRFNSDFHRFHADDMMKYKSNVPDSVSSSEISRNYGKNVLQKPSPYSSTTSLNSLDSTGMNLTAKQQPPVAPARKKRAAPRPPSQNSIPEQEIFGTTLNVFKEPHSILPRKNFHVSSPQLFNNNNISSSGVKQEAKSDKNNNIETGNRLNAITRPTSLYVTSTTEIDQNGSVGRQRSPSESSEVQQILHDRRNSNSLEKKKKPAPVPPKRVHKPVPSPRTIQDDIQATTITDIKEIDEEVPVRLESKIVDHSLNTSNVSKTMLNNIPPVEELTSVESSEGPVSIQIVSADSSIEPETNRTSSPKLPAVSKVHINKPEEERRSSSEDEMTVNIYNVTKSVVTLEKQNQMTVSTSIEERKIVHEPVEKRQSFEKPKTVVVPIRVEKQPSPAISPVEERKSSVTFERESKVETKSSPIVREVPVEVEQRSPSPLWTYTLPAPPVFADSIVADQVSPTDNQKQGDKFFSDFASTCNETVLSDSNTTVVSAETQIHPIFVDRRPSAEGFIMTPKEFTKVADDESDKSTEIITSDLEDGYLGNGIVGKIETPEPVVEPNRIEKEIVVEDFRRSRLLIARSDSFHSIGQGRNFDIGSKRTPLKPAQRSTSFLSLVQAHKAENPSSKLASDNAPYNRQKSASELSINDVPSLQSIEVLKNILNSSRKNSLQDASPKEEKAISFVREETSVERIVPMKIEEVERKPERVIPVKIQEPVKQIERVVPIVVEEPLRKPERQVSDSSVEIVKPAETQWRYTGPPKVNFTTWSERPKIEVAIAADSDYKFGGVSATLPRDFRNNNEVASKRHTIHISNERNSIDETEINTKPKVLGVEYKKDVAPVVMRESYPILRETQKKTANGHLTKEPTAEIVTKPSRTIINIKPRPMSMDMTNVYSSITTSTTPSALSYNRLNSNAKKFSPIVHGFKLNNIKEGDQADSSAAPVIKRDIEVKAFAPPNVPAKPAFLRSTSAGDISRKMKFSVVEAKVEDDPSSFSQLGLRKTGLKEKILLNDKETKSIFGKVVEPKQEIVLRHHNYEVKPENHVAVRSLSHPVPPKPPTLPPTMHFRKSAPVDSDTRNQLLDAIKTFNKDSLRRK